MKKIILFVFLAMMTLIVCGCKKYDITFIADGQVVQSFDYKKKADSVTEPPVPPKAGYTGSWSSYVLGSGDLTVNAVYTPITYTATFKADGLVVDTTTFNVETKTLNMPTVPVKAGYNGSWESYTIGPNNMDINAVYTIADYKVEFKVDNTVIHTEYYNINDKTISEPAVPEKAGYTGTWETYELTTGDKVVNAVYTPIGYTVTFKADGNVVETIPYDATNKNITEPSVPTKNGYNGAWEVYELITGNIVVNAVYTAIEYDVVFKADGNVVETFKYTVENKDITEPFVPNKPDYTGVWETYELTTGNIEVNAIYTPIPYNVIFKAEGKEVATLTYTIENKDITEPAVPEKVGYTGAWENYTLTRGEIIVEAIYTHIPLDVTFVLNYEGAPTETRTTVDGYIDFVPERTGYKFNGWWLSEGQTNDGYILTEEFDMSLVILEQNLVLYAEWVKIEEEIGDPTSRKQLDIPSVNIKQNVFSWNEVEDAESYNIIVICNSDYLNPVFEQTITKTSWTLPQEYVAGSYTIRVRSNGNGIDTINSDYVSKYYRHQMLDTVYGFKFDIDSSVLTWNPVTNAENYNLYIDGELIGSTSETSFDFSSYQSNYYYVRVEATKEDWVSGFNYYSFEKKHLLEPTLSVSFDNAHGKYVFEWTESINANQYFVFINGIQIDTTTQTKYELAYNLVDTNEFEVNVYAFNDSADYFQSPSSNVVTFNKYYKLTAGTDTGGQNLLINDYNRNSIYVEYSSKVKLGITTIDGYNFIGWFNGEELVSENINYEHTLTDDIELTAKFNYYLVTTENNIPEAGFFERTYNSEKVSIGTVISLKQYTHNGYNFLGWYIDDELVSTSNTFEYTMTNEDVIIIAKYNYFTVTTSSSHNNSGTITEYNNTKVSVGSTVKLEATLNPGYNFLGWFVDGECVSEDLVYEFEMTNSNITLTATYEEIPVTLIYMVNGVEYGRQDYTNESPVVEFKTYTAESGTRFFGWYADPHFSTNDTSVTTSATLAVDESNCAYVYGGTVNSYIFNLYIYDEEIQGYKITGQYSFNGHYTVDVPSEFNATPIKTLDYVSTGSNTLTTLNIGEGIEYITNKIIYGLSKLTSLELPSTVKEIRNQAFIGCTSLTEIHLPGSLKVISDDANRQIYSPSLQKVYYEGTVEDWCNIEFSTFANPMYYATEFYLNNELLTNLVIPESITSINFCQFYGFECLQSVTIHKGVNEIKSTAFSNCINLKTVTFESSSSLKTIEYSAFYKAGLETITIPASVEHINSSAFAYNSNLTKLDFEPNSKLTYMPNDIAYNCSNIVEITIPQIPSMSGTLHLGTNAITVYYQGDIEDWFALNTTKLFNGVCEHFYIYENNEYKEVVDLVIPESITTVPDNFFENYININSVTLHDNLTSIGTLAFANTNLTEVVIPSSVTTIGLNAFNSCDTLTSIIIEKINTIESDTTYFKYILGDSIDTITSVKIMDGTVPPKALDGILNITHLTVPYINNTSVKDGTLLGYMFGNELYADNYLFKITQSTSNSSGGDYTYYIPTKLNTVEILGGEISKYALMNFQHIKELTIGEQVTYIDSSITIRNYLLKTINYNAINATTAPVYGTNTLDVFVGLGKGQASTNNNVTVNIGDSVEYIPEFLFYEDTNVKYVNISDKSQLQSIGRYAFAGTNIAEIKLPKSLTSYANNAFLNCTNLANVYYLGNVNDWLLNTFESESANPMNNGVYMWFTNDSNAFERLDTLNISNIGKIGNYQFVNNTDLITLTISNVKSVGQYAFAGCTNLTTLTLENVTLLDVYSFNNCRGLTQINLPEGLTSLDSSFVNCSEVVNLYLPSSLRSSNNAFLNMTKLENVYYNGTFNDWLNILFTSFESNPMAYAKNLYVLDNENNYVLVENINIPSNIDTIGSYQLAGLNVQEVVIPNTVTYIGEGAFKKLSATNIYYDADITEGLSLVFAGTKGDLVIGKNVTIISNSMFRNSNLVNVSFEENSSCTTINSYAFLECTKLVSLQIPSSVTTIEKSALFGCSNLVTLEIPFTGISQTATAASKDSLFGVIFGTTTFENGVQIKQYYSSSSYIYAYIPKTLKNVKVNGTVLDYSFYNVSTIENVQFGTNVQSIGQYAFYGSSIKSLSFDENSNCTEIKNYAFTNCQSLSSVTLPDAIQTIRIYAFQNCSSIAQIVIPTTMQSIENYAFFNCTGLIAVQNLSALTITKGSTANGYVAYYAKVVFGEGENPIKNVDGFMFYDNGTSVTLMGYNGTSTTLTLPSDFNGSAYTIDSTAFKGNTTITAVTLPNTFTEVPANMFENCTSLTTVTLPNTITRINSSAFAGCTALKTINFPTTLTSLAKDAFTGCTSLIKTSSNVDYVNNWAVGVSQTATSITFTTSTLGLADELFYMNSTITTVKLQGSIKYLPANFFGWSSVKTVTLNAGLQVIGEKAFERCTKLTAITIPNSVLEIGNSAFSNCSLLATLTFQTTPKVATIGDYAFNKCTALKSVTLPISVKTLGVKAFYGCTSLTTFATGNGLTAIADETFSGCTALTTVTLGTKIESIGSKAFYGCDVMKSITIPASVTSIGTEAFKGCTDLTSVTFSDTTNKWTVVSSSTNTTISVATANNNSNYLKSRYASCEWTKNVA